MELSRLLRREIVDRDGVRVGRVADLAVRPDIPYPPVTELVVCEGRDRVVAPWGDVGELDEERVTLRGAGVPRGRVPDGRLLLGRDVMDTQIYDAAGSRFARVGDVRLARHGDALRVVGVEVGPRSVMRRLGLRRIAGRSAEAPIDWADVHLVAARGRALRIQMADRARRLTPTQLAQVVARLPTEHAAELLRRLPAEQAAGALTHSRPRVGGRLVRAVDPEVAARILDAMPGDDATSALRHLPASELDGLLAGLETARASELRRLLTHPPRTAAGLMNPAVITAAPTDDLERLRRLVADRSPTLDALMTVFVVDAGRLVGMIPPRGLLTGDTEPMRGLAIRADASVDDVIDLFALNDVVALPVVDDDGRLLGAIAVDDILEELLAERLPGRRRYRTVRRRRR